MVKSVYRKTLQQHVTEHLMDAMMTFELRPGERIIEGNLARDLGVAKTTLREALKDLEHRGLLIKSHRGATYVTKLAESDIHNLYSVRSMLEPEAASLAHQRLTAKEYSRLVTFLERMRDAGARHDYLEASKNDMGFHQCIWNLSGNLVLERALTAASSPLFAFSGLHLIGLFSTGISDFLRICEDHQTLLATIKEGPVEKIREVFTAKLQTFKEENLKGLQMLNGNVDRRREEYHRDGPGRIPARTE
jgi:DNA-binding GntR family transcriptional regulator